MSRRLSAPQIENGAQSDSNWAAQQIAKKVVAAIIVVGFMSITGLGMVAGHWQNDISHAEYVRHMQHLDSYDHPTGAAQIEELNRQTAPMVPGNTQMAEDITGGSSPDQADEAK